MKLPPPSEDITQTNLWPTAPEGTASLSHRIMEARADVLLAVMQEMRLDMASMKDAIASLQRRRSSVGSSVDGAATVENPFRLQDEERAELMQSLASVNTLPEAVTMAAKLYMDKDEKIYTRQSAKANAAALNFKEIIVSNAPSLDEESRQELDGWDAKTATKMLMTEQKRIQMTLKGKEAVVEKDRLEVEAGEEDEAVDEAGLSARRGRRSNKRQHIVESDDEEDN